MSKGSDCSPLIPRSADPSGAGGRELLLQQVCAAEVGRAARPVEWEEGAAQRVPGRSSEVRGWPDIADEDGDSAMAVVVSDRGSTTRRVRSMRWSAQLNSRRCHCLLRHQS